MRCNIASLEQLGTAVGNLTKYAELATAMSEEKTYYLKVVLNELIINSFKYGGAQENQVKVEVDVKDDNLLVTVDDGGHGIESSVLGRCADVYSESGRGLAIVKGLCQSVELNPAGNCITARLSIH